MLFRPRSPLRRRVVRAAPLDPMDDAAVLGGDSFEFTAASAPVERLGLLGGAALRHGWLMGDCVVDHWHLESVKPHPRLELPRPLRRVEHGA